MKRLAGHHFFLIFYETGHFIEVISNPALSEPGGISRIISALMVDMDISMVVAASIGDKMKTALTNKNIEIILKTGKADDAVRAVLQK